MRKRKIINYFADAAIFIILEIAALTILCYNGELQDSWFGKAGHNISSAIWGWADDISNYFSLDEKNDSLAIENARLYSRISALEKIIEDSVLVARINCDSLPQGFRYTPAKISKLSSNTQHNYLILDKGAADGIAKGSGIITTRGVVGVIDVVGENYSYARSFMNHNTTIGARLGLSGPAGSLAWNGEDSNKAILREIPHHMEVFPEDTVYTSGFSFVFPPDIPLGVVESSRVVNGASHEITVRLFEDFKALRHVIVVENTDKAEISLLEEEQR